MPEDADIARVPEPTPPRPDPDHPTTALASRVRDALTALPIHFQSPTVMEGLDATDLFALNTVLGATIEVQVVAALNRMREVWDPDGEWPLYEFVRQAQTFPDVLLRRRSTEGVDDVAMGIELKGWYLLAKEAVPSFRYTVTPHACSEWDLLVVVPWCLSNVVSGKPRVLAPGIWSARFAAEFRNYWWQHIKQSRGDTTIRIPDGVVPYSGRDHTVDEPVSDSGHNFGRIARTGIMDDWIDDAIRQPLAGIPARDWAAFLRKHTDDSDPEAVWSLLSAEAAEMLAGGSATRAEEVVATLRRLTALLADE